MIDSRIAAAVATVCVLALAAPAGAQDCEAPPGTSAIEEYCETVPAAAGDRFGNRGGSAGAPVTPPSATLRALDQGGSEGKALRRLIEAPPSGSDDPPAPLSGPRSEAGPLPAPGDDPLAAVVSAVGSGPVASPALGWALLVVALGGMSAWWLGPRRGDRQS